jgi:hypothetical protein
MTARLPISTNGRELAPGATAIYAHDGRFHGGSITTKLEAKLMEDLVVERLKPVVEMGEKAMSPNPVTR